MLNEDIYISIKKLEAYIEGNNYRGYDPYDALKSPFFKWPILKNNKLIRFGTQQLLKRLPFSIRPLLLIPKGYNPVTLGLCIQAYAYLYESSENKKSEYLKKINFLIEELIALVSDEFSGACWGYDFDWEARHAKIPAYQPTVVATGIISNALFIAHKITKNEKAAELVKSASRFVINDLNRTYSANGFCFSYSPFDKQQVFNASMKGVRILAQAYTLERRVEYKKIAKQAVAFVVSHQKEDGSWGYSLAKEGDWTDNYHTGYVLDCLDEYQSLCDDYDYKKNIDNGYRYYISNLLKEERLPKFYNNTPYPLDCTAASQMILTTLRFGDKETALRVADVMVNRMQKKNGSFKFRAFRLYTIRTSFMRWSDAWMFVALANIKLCLDEEL